MNTLATYPHMHAFEILNLKRQLKKAIATLQEKDVDALIEERIEKYAAIGQVANIS